jgi:hypothetical protein
LFQNQNLFYHREFFNNIIGKIMEETEDEVSTSLLEGDETAVPEEMKEDTDGTSDDATIEENSSNDQDSSGNNALSDRNITTDMIDAAVQTALDDIMNQEPSC